MAQALRGLIVEGPATKEIETTTTCRHYPILNLLFILYLQISTHSPIEGDFRQGAKGGDQKRTFFDVEKSFPRREKNYLGETFLGSPLVSLTLFCSFLFFLLFIILVVLILASIEFCQRGKRLAPIGISIEFPTYYSILLPSITKSSSITPVQYPLGPEPTFHMSSEIANPSLGMHSEKEPSGFRSEEQPTPHPHKKGETHSESPSGRVIPSRVGMYLRRFEQQLVEYSFEARGIERVHEGERMKKLSWVSYTQAFLLWVSINLAANNITLGMLGPVVYGLSFLDSALCAVLGALLGSVVSSWMATRGPISGIRTMAFGRYAMGWWPSKIVVILNLIQMLGYCLIDCVVGGQILSAVSPNGNLSVAVGIVIIALISWVVATFGIDAFHYYERYAFLPQLIVVCILFGVSSSKYDLSTPSMGDARTIIGNRLSFFSICVSAAITYAPLAADFFVYYPEGTSKLAIFSLSLSGLMVSFTLAFLAGIGLASGIPSHLEYSAAYAKGAGALIVEGFGPLHGFGKFCSVVVALGLIANTVAPTYSAGVDFQILGRYAEKVPRAIWNTIGVVIYIVCALAGRSHLSEIFTNFLALMGYWVAIWIAIILEERFIFRLRSGYNWYAWNDPSKLPVGIAAFIAFLVGWAGAVLCMAQLWYIGPLAKSVGEYGADMGNYVGFTWAGLVYPPLRYIELRWLKR